MGIRFRKSINLGGGTKLNLSKSGVGISSGIKGARKSISTSGRSRTTVSIPGTGISYVKESNRHARKSAPKKSVASSSGNSPKKPFFQRGGIIVIALLLLAPLGIYLMWRYTSWKKGVKAVLSVLCGLIWLIAVIPSGSKAPPEALDDSPSRTIVSPQPDNNDSLQSMEVEAPEDHPEPNEPSAPEDDIEVDEEGITPLEPGSSQDLEITEPEPDTGSGGDRSLPSDDPGPDPVDNPQVPSSDPITWAYVGSIDSNKYHYPSCQHAKKILPENLIGWNTVAEAEAAGYQPCGVCHPH